MNSAVEALTAKVYVLQVGSKPVTLSAARQLDRADAAVITPFGRVRIDPNAVNGLVEVIGSVNGTLVRSSARTREVTCPGYADPDGPYATNGRPKLTCGQHRNTSPDTYAPSHSWTEYSPSQAIYETWRALPLIVLAGLR